ncbi:MAPEG family protein [Novosphingobium sp.]|uniref:MAPEG family protein n=1 Tax=Novosphingobium sp. TaxID=1874826 RepID=UPI003D0E2370
MNDPMRAAMLAPAALLVLWSMVMLVWMLVTRIPAMGGLAALRKAPAGGRGAALDRLLPDRVNWKAHNFINLAEQPTLFYATSVILALTGAERIDVAFAALYVALRIVHSLWQALVNRIAVRFGLFIAYSSCLMVLAIRAVASCLAGALA